MMFSLHPDYINYYRLAYVCVLVVVSCDFPLNFTIVMARSIRSMCSFQLSIQRAGMSQGQLQVIMSAARLTMDDGTHNHP